VAHAYKIELDRINRTPHERRAELVRGLLANELETRNGLGYELDDAWHIGLIATGAGVETAVQSLMTAGIAGELLAIRCSEQAVWGWLGSSRPAISAEVMRLTSEILLDGMEFAIPQPTPANTPKALITQILNNPGWSTADLGLRMHTTRGFLANPTFEPRVN
jgi:hypothetical protein